VQQPPADGSGSEDGDDTSSEGDGTASSDRR
jgi:hypothetical protein